jgi:hypothetical protein
MKTIQKYHKRIRRYVKRNPARAAGYVSTFTLTINKIWNFKSLGLIMFFGALMIGLGESAQRAENRKTIAAIYVKNEGNVPDDKIIDRLVD